MKIKLFLAMIMLAFIGIPSISYASFPVQNSSNEASIVVKSNDDLSSPAIVSGGKSQLTAVLLCFFLGGLGIHRFYLGYTWQGIVQILTLGGLGVWVLIDFIRILIGDLQPKNGSYDKTL